MRRSVLRVLSLMPFALALVSCGLLFAPMEERANPLDPKAQLVVVTLTPDPDGTVLASPPLNESVLSVSSAQYAVMSFGLANLPDVVTLAQLTLECSGGVFQWVELFPILEPWDAATIDTVEVTTDGFLASAPAATGNVNAAGAWVFDLTHAIRGMPYGIAVRGTLSGFVNFYSSGGGTVGPRLYIEGYNE